MFVGLKNSSLDLLREFACSGQACEDNVQRQNRMVFAVELKWVVERLHRGLCLAFTQFLSRLVAPAPSLIARAISAMSILYQQWRLSVGLVSIVSAQRAKTCPSLDI